MKKSLSKLEREQCKVESKNYLELGSLEQSMQILMKLNQKRSLSIGDPGRFVNEKSRDITLQTAKYFAVKDWHRLYFLVANDKLVAGEFNLEYKEKMFCLLKGFNPDFYKYRVGSLLTLKVLEEYIVKGITEYDLMQGDEAYKFNWTSKYKQNLNINGLMTNYFQRY